MELMNPIAIIICLILAVILFFIKLNRKAKYTNGKKVANTKYVKETEYYKTKVKKYKTITNLIKIVSAICIVMTSILIARPVTILTKSEEKYNRDIILSLDASRSECAVNLELVKKLKKIVPDLQGDRIGIVMYNTAPIVYCPLTTDYNYVNECLDKMEKQFQLVTDNNGYVPSYTRIRGRGSS